VCGTYCTLLRPRLLKTERHSRQNFRWKVCAISKIRASHGVHVTGLPACLACCSSVVTPSLQVRLCEVCRERRAVLRRPKTGASICRECFFTLFEDEVHRTIVDNKLFRAGERVAIAASGGKGACLGVL
jgi:hypothetical protein